MDVELPLNEMTVEEKFRAMESIWESLRDSVEKSPPPSSRVDTVRERKVRMESGDAKYTELSDAK